MPETSIEIKDGTNQILPNATQSTQIFIGDSAIQQIQQQAQRNAPYVQVLYFVFDGFDDIPSEHKENICKLIEKLQWEKARFLLSGKIEGLFKLILIRCSPNSPWLSRLIWRMRMRVVTWLARVAPTKSWNR